MPSVNELSYGNMTSGSNNNVTYKAKYVRYMTGKDPISFRLLPAFDPANPNKGTSFLPCVNEEGNLSDWGVSILIAKYCGHGGNTDRVNCVSRKNLGNDEYDPYSEVLAYIKGEPEDWGYLTEDIGTWGAPGHVKACLPPLKPLFVANVFDMDKPDRGVQIGEFTISSARSLYDRTSGLVFARNTLPNADEMIAKNYLYAYANGDITHPVEGPVLVLDRDTNSGRKNYSGYRVVVDYDVSTRKVRRQALTQRLLAERYDLLDVESFLNVPDPQQAANQLVKILNQKSPKGYHEWAMLKLALPDCKIPPVQSSPGTAHSVPGFTAPQSVPPKQANAPAIEEDWPSIDGSRVPDDAVILPFDDGSSGADAVTEKIASGIPGEVSNDDLLSKLRSMRGR